MKIKRLGLSVVLFLSMMMTAAAASKPALTDDFLNDTVKQHLASDAVVKGGAIDVEVKDGVVTLKGKVAEARQKEKAEKIAKKVSGVKSVVNEIKIEKL